MVGIDSSTFRIIGPLVEAGELPTLQRLLAEGAHGNLLSTIPSVTPPGWVTSYTGVNPGKHGVFDFKDHTRYIEGSPEHRLASTSSSSIRAPTFWSLLNDAGVSTGLLNLPMTYPVGPVRGYVVAGTPCGDDPEGSCWPPEVFDEVMAAAPDYTPYMGAKDMEEARPDRYLEAVNRVAASRTSAALRLMATRPTDVVVVAFTEVDRVQHYFWNCWDEGHPTHCPDRARYGHAFRDHYRVIDSGIGKLMEAAGPDAHVLVYSDHGSAPLHRLVFVNTFLVQRGIITMKGTKKAKGTGEAPVMREGLLDRRRLGRALERFHLGGVARVVPRSIKRRFPTWTLETVDWSRTRSYMSSRGAQAVTVNLRGREPEGCVEPGEEYESVVEEVVDVLGELVDPATGESPFAAINRRDELYRGPLADEGPDIVLRPAPGTMAIEYFREHTFEDVGTGWEERSSEHEREGIVILWGPGVKAGLELADRHIEDIAPTVLPLSGAGVPRYMDGEVIEKALDEVWLGEHPVRSEGPDELVPTSVRGPTMSREEEDLLKERLRGLGYMG